MEELIAQITEKTGMAADKARQVVEIVRNYLEDNLPDSAVDSIRSAMEKAGDVAASAPEKAGAASATTA